VNPGHTDHEPHTATNHVSLLVRTKACHRVNETTDPEWWSGNGTAHPRTDLAGRRKALVYPRLVRLRAHAILLFGCLGIACHDEATRRCHDVMASAQELVKNVDAKDLASVQTSLSAVDQAIEACKTAKRTSEVDALTRARNELGAHADYLKKRAERPDRKKPSAEELAALVTKGDPNCPKGQAYKQEASGKEIRCTGPQIVDMSFPEAEKYFGNRGYKLTTSATPPTLTAEYGAEKYVFTYAAPGDEHAPRCLTVYPAPGLPYQEATGRATGVLMKKIEKDGTVKTAHGEIPIHVEESETKLVIRLGECG